MFKHIASLIITLSLSANTYIMVDIAQGITKKEWKELGGLAYPDKKDKQNIYTDKEKIFLYSFNEYNVLAKDLTYRNRNKKESQWRDTHKKYNSFFSQLKKYGVKKRNYITSNIIFVVDTSGSMKKNNVIQEVKSTIEYLIDSKSKKAKVAIVTFDGKKGMKESQKARVVSSFTKSKAKLLSVVDEIKPSRYDTFLGAGLSKVKHLLAQSGAKKTLILLFTDGKAVDDKEKALKIISEFKTNGIKLKVVAVGGADVEMLKSFTTTGYVFNATSNDLKSMTHGISVANDEIFLRQDSFLENTPPLTNKDRLIIYSSMMNVDAQSDFYIVPNISSTTFAKEMQTINNKRGLNPKFNDAKIYVRITGKKNGSEVNKLKIFWKNYFKEHGGNIHFFANAPLSKSKLQ